MVEIAVLVLNTSELAKKFQKWLGDRGCGFASPVQQRAQRNTIGDRGMAQPDDPPAPIITRPAAA